MSPWWPKLTKAGNLFEILKYYPFPDVQFVELLDTEYIYIKYLCFPFTYSQPLPNYCNQALVINVKLISHGIWDIKLSSVPFLIFQNVINLILGPPSRRGSSVFMTFSMWELCGIDSLILVWQILLLYTTKVFFHIHVKKHSKCFV